MTGPDYDEDGPETFRPAPHPDDRLWRHPSEIAAMHAAAHAETAKVPVVSIDKDAPTPRRRSRRARSNAAVLVAAGVVAVGATALSIGVLARGDSDSTPELAAVSVVDTDSTAPTASGATARIGNAPTTGDRADGEAQLAARVHDEVADSLPRIQAVVPGGMREGSGLFVTPDGHIATSASLIDGADYVVAWTQDGQRWKAHLVAADPISDVAVIQIDSAIWPAIELDAQDQPRTGQFALALDHHDSRIRLGEVTNVSEPLLGVDQPIALPGSAILDDTGTVIAMVVGDVGSVGEIRSGSSSRLATPAWVVQRVSQDLIDHGDTTHNWIGLVIADHTEVMPGAVIEHIVEGSPADDSRLRVGDVVTTVDDITVDSAADLHRALQRSAPGDQVALRVERNDRFHTFPLVVAELVD